MRRDRLREAVDWVMEAVLLGMEHELEAEDVLRLDADKVVAMFNKPKESEKETFVPPFLPQLAGWPNVFYGDPDRGDE